MSVKDRIRENLKEDQKLQELIKQVGKAHGVNPDKIITVKDEKNPTINTYPRTHKHLFYSDYHNLHFYVALEEVKTIVVRSPHGEGRREVPINEVQIPNLWHTAQSLNEPHKSMVLETWHLAHDLLENLRGNV